MNALKILGIDTSGKTASVAITENDIVLGQTTIYTEKTHSQVILPLCKKLLEDCGTELKDIDGFAVSVGPGSYTGLRIGISAVKAMAFALDKKCYGISTLESLAYNAKGFVGYIIPVMKARANLVYNAVFKCNDIGETKRTKEDRIISVSDLKAEVVEILESRENIILTGDYAEEFQKLYGEVAGLILAPAHIRLQSASSLCGVAEKSEPVSADDLEAVYMQPTRAEKELNSK